MQKWLTYVPSCDTYASRCRSDCCYSALSVLELCSATLSTLSAMRDMFSIVDTRKQQKIRTHVISGITVQMSADLLVLKKSMSNTISRHARMPNTASMASSTTPVLVDTFSIFLLFMIIVYFRYFQKSAGSRTFSRLVAWTNRGAIWLSS